MDIMETCVNMAKYTNASRPKPAGLKRAFDQELIPVVVDAAAWCEARALGAEESVQHAPIASVLLAFIGGVALATGLIPRRGLPPR